MPCSEPIQRKPQRAPLWRWPKAASFALALNKAHVLALNTAHVLRLSKADVLALNKAHVLRLNNEICPMFRANAKEAAFGCLHKGGRPSAAPLCGFLCIGSEQSTCPSSQHSTCLASQQGRCLGSQQGTCLASHQSRPSQSSPRASLSSARGSQS